MIKKIFRDLFMKRCVKCGKYRFIVKKRQYTVPKVSARPITTTDEICNKCEKSLAKVIKLT